MICHLAEALPGTPLRDLWEMDVVEGCEILLARAAIAREAAARMNERLADARRAGAPGGAVRTVTGGLEVLGRFLKRGAR